MKKTFRNKKAFTLIELLIVIAIIGILFIVLVSKVDFATDKSKATGVQTDFRSYQVALEQVAKENAGFNTFGWDVCDLNGNRVRDSYDVGDINQNGKQDDGEVFIGRKEYGEEFAGIYTLTNPADTSDMSAVRALEAAINANLDPKLHLVIHDDFTITMANQATDPWKNEYHGRYQSNAGADGMDRGAIFLYSKGANGDNGSADGIVGGLVNITTPQNNITGQDDYVLATFYSYANGYGEVQTVTKGFSQNQTFNDGSNVPVTPSVDVPVIPGYLQPVVRKNQWGLWLNKVYEFTLPEDSGAEEILSGIAFVFKEDNTADVHLVLDAQGTKFYIPLQLLLILEGNSNLNIEELLATFDSFVIPYSCDENGITISLSLDGDSTEATVLPFDKNTQQLCFGDVDSGLYATVTDVRRGNIHMYQTYKSFDTTLVPDLKAYPDGTWKLADGTVIPAGTLIAKHGLLWAHEDGIAIPIGLISIDGKDIIVLSDNAFGTGPNGEIIPTWSVR